MLPSDDALLHLEHAALCSTCSAQLKEALEIVGTNAPPETKLQQSLQTGTPTKQKSLAAEMAERSRKILKSEALPATLPFTKKPRRNFHFPVWAYGAVAAVLVLGVALAVFLRQGLGSTERLLGQAYTQQRTVELRIPGAGYGPVRVERGQKQSQMSSPGALLEAEAAIKKGLEQHPNDPDLLRQKAEADLLNWDFQPAIETLGHALRIQPESPKLLVDLATAHFERAEATDTPADYESALQYLGDALRLSPKDPVALFNRAILYERLFLYSSAIADWELLLTLETDTGWKQEAQKRLNDLKTKQQRHSARDAPDHLTPNEFKTATENKTSFDPEQYIELAERKILPEISHPNQQDPNYQLAMLLAQHFESAHADRFFVDLLQSAGQPEFREAAQLLGRSSTANTAGHSEEAYSDAVRSAHIFQSLHSNAGRLAATFHEAYALQFESRPEECLKTAAALTTEAQALGYRWLEIQSRFEQAICSNMKGDLDVAKQFCRHGITLAKDHSYTGFHLRGLMILATLEADSGDESGAWSAIQEGLGRYWSATLPAMRAYSFYFLLDRIAERLEHWNVQFAAAHEALGFISNGPDKVIEAAERSRLADAALRLGDARAAQEQFARAAQLFAHSPQTESVQWRKLEAQIGLARAQSLQDTSVNTAFTKILEYLPEVKRLSNRYVEFQYYATLAELKARAAEPQQAEKWALAAIRISDNALKSLHTWRGQVNWAEQHRKPYLLLTALLFRAGKTKAALGVWEHFRTASWRPLESFDVLESSYPILPAPVNSSQRTSSNTVLTYTFTGEGVIIWVRNSEGVHGTYLPIAPAVLKRTAETFLEECARPDSDIANLRADAQALYTLLIKPIAQWLPSNGSLIIEPDGPLGKLPLEALVDSSGAYFGDRYAITMTPLLATRNGVGSEALLQPVDKALIVAAPTSGSGSQEPPPGAASEAYQVSEQFPHSTVLSGTRARLANVRKGLLGSSVFHYVGHARVGRAGAMVTLADGALAIDETGADLNSLSDKQDLKNVKLAVFSACATARAGEVAQSNSLVNQFLQAGVRTVVASRWNVDSMSTTDLMVSFYSAALSGHSVPVALQNASRAFRNNSGRLHPYYWAAFSAFGESNVY
jgi:CHAT domain-containing protein/cytochrome c-type biogenesis protein CcmH/NrfG